MKKKLSVLLAATMLMSAFAGCNKDQAKPNGTGEANQTGGNKESIVVQLGMCPFEEESQEVWDKYNKDLETFKEKRPEVEIKNARYDYSPDTFVALAESGNLPTVFGTWFTEPQKLISNGYAADITEVLKERGWYDSMNKSILNIVSDKDGKVYGLPSFGYALGLLMNVDLFKQAGLVDEDGIPLQPKTWQEVAQYAQKIKEATGTPGFCLLGQDNGAGWHFTNLAWGFGAQFCVDNGDGTYSANVNSPEAIEAMQFVKDLKWKYDVLTADPLSENGGTALAHMAAGTAAMTLSGNDGMKAVIDNGGEIGDFAYGSVPAGPKGQYSLLGGTVYMFAPDATKEEINAALDFLELYEGIGPNVSEETMESNAKLAVELGRPVLPALELWDNPEIKEIEKRVIENNANMDSRLYQPYFDTTSQEGNLHAEEVGATQDLYAELTKVIQAVVTDQNADVASLMETANQNYQTFLNGLK